jgi:serine/threonine protein kinase
MSMADPLIGRKFANYQIERLIGRGGMASVYYGIDFSLQRPAAIKVIDERYSGNDVYTARFIHEARAMASWRHANIPQIYQAGVENGIYYYAMEYIHGIDLEEDLRRYARKGEGLPYADILRIGEAIAAALDYAHQKGAIHRDVKPSNILIAEDNRILLTDFGLVLEVDKGTRGEVFGSPLYIAPEQARSSADAVPQSDLYSLGVMLYEMLVGKLPFNDLSPASLALKHIMLEPPAPRQVNPDLSQGVETVLLKALRKLPQERYQTGKALMTALKTELQGQSTAIRRLHAVLLPPVTQPFLVKQNENQPQPTLSKLEPTSFQPQGTYRQPPQPPIFNQKTGIPGEFRRPRLAFLKNRYFRTAILVLFVLAFTSFCYLETPLLIGKLNELSPTSLVAAVTTTPIKASPIPTAVNSKFDLFINPQNGDGLFVTNLGSVDIPLAMLRFEGEKGKLSGDEWGIEVLRPGQCVIVWKTEGHAQPPKDVSCEVVGKLLGRSGPAKFWSSGFDVYYQNILIATCTTSKTPCDLQFSKSP